MEDASHFKSTFLLFKIKHLMSNNYESQHLVLMKTL